MRRSLASLIHVVCAAVQSLRRQFQPSSARHKNRSSFALGTPSITRAGAGSPDSRDRARAGSKAGSVPTRNSMVRYNAGRAQWKRSSRSLDALCGPNPRSMPMSNRAAQKCAHRGALNGGSALVVRAIHTQSHRFSRQAPATPQFVATGRGGAPVRAVSSRTGGAQVLPTANPDHCAV